MDGDERIARLELRLEKGFRAIGEAMHKGIDVDHWEDAWGTLLKEYENLEDECAAHHAEVRQQVAMSGMPRNEVAA